MKFEDVKAGQVFDLTSSFLSYRGVQCLIIYKKSENAIFSFQLSYGRFLPSEHYCHLIYKDDWKSLETISLLPMDSFFRAIFKARKD